MSRRSARNRHRAPAAHPDYRRIAELEQQLGMISSVLPEEMQQQLTKARRGPAPAQAMLTLSTTQVQALLAAGQQQYGQPATPLPRPPEWSQSPFPPGQPLVPGPINRVRPDTGRAEPRLFELPISTNINIGTAPYVPWRILTEAADMPLFRKCIQRRKTICDLDFAVVVDPAAVAREEAATGEAKTDIESRLRRQYASEIARISEKLTEPDPKNGYEWPAWTSQLMENRLVYDATAVYPRKTYGGDLFALEVIDGSTIKPLLDEYGGRPLPPYPFCQQILYGFPRGEFTADADWDAQGNPWVPGGYTSDELMYERTVIRPKTPYGMSATEMALLDGIVWMRRMGWILAEYTEGTLPTTIVETDNEIGWDVPQWEAWLTAMNDHLGGSTGERHKFRLFPPGTHPVEMAQVPERYKPDYDMFLIKLVAGDFGLTATELGFPEVGSLGASFHEGEADVLQRVTRGPDARWVGRVATRLAIRHMGMPPVLQVKILGLESEDEALADQVATARIARGVMSRNEDRARVGLPSLQFEEADMMTIDTGRGVVFLDGASKLAPPGTLIQPAHMDLQPGEGDDVAAGPAKPIGQPAQSAHQAAAAKAEVRAFRAWAAKGTRGRPFECKTLTAALAKAFAPELLGDPRVVLAKDGDVPKARAGHGLATSGTRC